MQTTNLRTSRASLQSWCNCKLQMYVHLVLLRQTSVFCTASTSHGCFLQGTNTGPPVDVPIGANTEQLTALARALIQAQKGKLEDSDKGPLAFYLDEAEIASSLHASLAASGGSVESTLTVRYHPLATFRVMPVTRCSDTLPGHGDSVLHVHFSPDGGVMASAGGDGMVRIWDAGTNLTKYVCKGHTAHVLCVAFSPCGTMVASGDFKGQVRLWDVGSGAAIGAPLAGHKKWITSLAWEPLHASASTDGCCVRLATASKDGAVKIWSARTQRFLFSCSGHRDSVESLKWGGDGLLYTGSRDRTVKVWAVGGAERGKLVRSLAGHGHRVNALALSTEAVCRTGPFDHTGLRPETAEGAMAVAKKRYESLRAQGPERLVSASDDATLFLWHPSENKNSTARMTGHQQPVNHIAFSPDTRLVASASFDKKVKVWDGFTGAFLMTFTGHVAAAYQVAWSGDSRYLASASKDSTVKVWAAPVANVAVAASAAGVDEADKDKKGLKGPQRLGSKAVFTLAGHADEVFALDWSPNGEKVASGSRDRTIKM